MFFGHVVFKLHQHKQMYYIKIHICFSWLLNIWLFEKWSYHLFNMKSCSNVHLLRKVNSWATGLREWFEKRSDDWAFSCCFPNSLRNYSARLSRQGCSSKGGGKEKRLITFYWYRNRTQTGFQWPTVQQHLLQSTKWTMGKKCVTVRQVRLHFLNETLCKLF